MLIQRLKNTPLNGKKPVKKRIIVLSIKYLVIMSLLDLCVESLPVHKLCDEWNLFDLK